MDEQDLFELAKYIALFLGNGSCTMTYDANGLVVVYATIDEAVEVQYCGTTVFKQCGSSGLESYVPGGWESLLAAVKPMADRAKETQTQRLEAAGRNEKSEKSDKLRKAWGLGSADGRAREGKEPRKPGPGGVMEKPAG